MPGLKDVLEDSFSRHDPDSKLQKIMDAITGINTAVGAMELVVDSLKTDIAQLKTDVAEIKFFLEGGMPPPLNPEDQQALDARLAQDKETAQKLTDLATEVGSIHATPPT